MAHNGGKLQANPWSIQIGRDYTFINLFKTCQNWSHVSGGTQPAPNEMDGNGYPNAANGTATWTTKGGVYTVFWVPSANRRPGKYILKWLGDGTLTCSGTRVSGSLSGNNGRVVIDVSSIGDTSGQPGSVTINLGIVGRGSSDYIRHIAFVHEDDELAYNGGAIFGTKIKQRISEGGIGVWRFLDWMGGSSSTHASLDTEKPVSNFSYHGGVYRADLYAGDTTNVGDAYALPAPQTWPGLVDKARVVGRFNVSAVGDNQTLNVAGTGAKPLIAWLHFGPCAQVYTRPFANIFFTAIYDADLDSWILRGGADPANGGGQYQAIEAPVHMSIMVQLCNEVGAHPWFTIPPLCLDPLTDYPAALATYCKNNLDPGLIPHFEPSNEVWNNASGFSATRYAWAKEKLRNGGVDFDEHNWYGRVLSKLGQAVSAVYGDDRTKYRVVCGVQTRNTNAPNARLASTRLVTESGNPNDAAKFWTTHVAPTGYWNSSYTYTQELAVAQEYLTANAARQAEILVGYLRSNTLTSDAANYAYWKNWGASLFGVNGLCQYEGGYSQDYLTGDLTNPVTAVTKATQAIVTVSNANAVPAVGMSVSFTGVGGMTQLNGNTYTVVAVGGQNVTINVDSSAFTTFTSGGTMTVVGSKTLINGFRETSKNSPELVRQTLRNWHNLTDVGGEFPSIYMISGHGNAWSVLDPDVYVTPDPPQWEAAKLFKAGKRRFLLT